MAGGSGALDGSWGENRVVVEDEVILRKVGPNPIITKTRPYEKTGMHSGRRLSCEDSSEAASSQ